MICNLIYIRFLQDLENSMGTFTGRLSLSFYGKEQREHCSKHLLLCSMVVTLAHNYKYF